MIIMKEYTNKAANDCWKFYFLQNDKHKLTETYTFTKFHFKFFVFKYISLRFPFTLWNSLKKLVPLSSFKIIINKKKKRIRVEF